MILKNKILDILFPPVCGFCNKIDKNCLCQSCSRKYNEIKCSTIDNYTDQAVHFDEHYYIFKYEKDIREYILKYKFDEISYLYKTFARFIINDEIFKENFINKFDCIISVPIHKKRFKTRGYNQSELIAKEVSNIIGKTYYSNALIKNKNITPQSTLDKLDRVGNAREAFCVGEDINFMKGLNVALFDDIFTTGSTVNECARVLKLAGVENVGIFTIAKA